MHPVALEPAPDERLGALELDLSALWAQRTPDEAFVLLFPKAVFAVVEQPAAMKAVALVAASACAAAPWSWSSDLAYTIA